MRFNEDQRRCIECDGNLLIVAPPGSGKTGTLVGKAVRILERPDTQVGMVTFTDAAAKEMRHRILSQVGPGAARRVFVETFHKHAIRQLRAGGKLGRLITPSEQFGIVVRAISEVGEPMDARETLEAIEKAKSNIDFSGRETPVVEAYQSILARYRANDLMDVIRLSVVGMRDESIRPLQVTHLLGDEFQDADPTQLEWIMQHRDAGAVVTCVGDDDQAIYAWRRSLGYAGMMEFKRRAQADEIALRINYRSRLRVIQTALAVIAKNTERIDKEVLCARGREGPGWVEVISETTVATEADSVVARIKEDTVQHADGLTVPKGRWAVIARTNRALRPIALALRAAGIEYSRPGGKDVLDGALRTCLLLLSSIQTADVLTIDGALSGLGFTHAELTVLHKGLGDEYDTLLEGELPDLSEVAPESATRLRRLCQQLLPAWRQEARKGHYRNVVRNVANYLRDTGIVQPNERDEFDSDVQRMLDRGGSLVSMTAPFLMPLATKEGDGVVLHTMHSCKGLEYDRVAVIRCNEGTIPSPKNPVTTEERRLFFVAMTRARSDLFICHAAAAGAPSPYVNEVRIALA